MPEMAARMEFFKITGIELMLVDQDDGQGIAHGQHGCGTRGGRQPQGTGLFGDTDVNNNIAGFGQGRALGLARESDDRTAEMTDAG